MTFLRRPKNTPEPGGVPSGPDVRAVELAGRTVPVVLRANKRARRISLRIDAHGDDGRDAAVLTFPPRLGERAALAFLMEQRDWVLNALDALPPRLLFADGTVIPYLGRDRVIRHTGACGGRGALSGARRSVQVEADEILVAGHGEHLPRRLRDFIKRDLHSLIQPLAREKAARIERTVAHVTIRDQKTRWGSCTAKGVLNFSWRLAFAPPDVLDYVVAHEVAHLRHMDHSPAFWQTVAELTPDPSRHRKWLRAHGARLHRIG